MLENWKKKYWKKSREICISEKLGTMNLDSLFAHLVYPPKSLSQSCFFRRHRLHWRRHHRLCTPPLANIWYTNAHAAPICAHQILVEIKFAISNKERHEQMKSNL